MKQAGLIMFCGRKPPHFSTLIAECQDRVRSILGDDFLPYEMDKVHATLVSLEAVRGSSRMNLNFERYRGQQRRMNFHSLLAFILLKSGFPFQVQIGGFHNEDYTFASQGQRPYERSFSVMRDKVVVMGWPIQQEPPKPGRAGAFGLSRRENVYPNTLEEIRRSLQAFNVLHTYHQRDTDIDNDFYFRIGLAPYLSSIDPRRDQVEQDMRQFLSNRQPIILDVTLADLYVVSYEDDRLLPSSIQTWPINSTRVTPDFISHIYGDIS